MWKKCALTGDAIDEANAAAGAAAGEMVNASASDAAADINDECLRWLSKPSVTSEGGGGLAMADMWIQWWLADIWIQWWMEERIDVCADVECTHAVVLCWRLAMTDGPCWCGEYARSHVVIKKNIVLE